MSLSRQTILFVALAGAVGCSDPVEVDDAGPNDSGGVLPDSGPQDLGVLADAGPMPDAEIIDMGVMADAGPADVGSMDAGPAIVDVRVPGLTGSVEVRFDEQGVLHVRCDNDLDCFAVQGYFTAAERFGQMDFRRRAARGRLSELYGPATIETDFQLRSFLATRTGGRVEQQLWDATDADTKAVISAYTRGINAWIADLRAQRNGARLTQENANSLRNITDWEELDSAACALVLVAGLTNSSGEEAAAGQIFADMPVAQAFDLFGLRPGSPSTVLPRPAAVLGDDVELQQDLQNLQDRLTGSAQALGQIRPFPDLGIAAAGFGSNNWIVSPGQSASGSALLANDPHLGFSNPAVWFVVSLDSKTAGQGGTIHVAGSSFAGLPGILIGQNEDIAWGLTTTFFDMSDVYVETLNQDGSGVLFNKGEVAFVEQEYTVEVVGSGPQTRTYQYVPHHGIVTSVDSAAGIATTVRWTGQDLDTDLNFIMALMRATSVTDARDNALRHVTSVGQNFVIAGRNGDIGWFPYNRLPMRPWASAQLAPWLPLPGDGSAEWQGWIAYDDLPQALNPPQGFLATANNDMTGALQDGDATNDGNFAFQTYAAVGYRHERIMERLVQDAPNHTPAVMSDIQADIHSLLAERTLGPILSELPRLGVGPSLQAQNVIDALTAWQYTCPTGLVDRDPASAKVSDTTEAAESIGCSAFHVLWTELMVGVFDDEIVAAGVQNVSRHARHEALIRLLTSPGTLLAGPVYWDDVSTAGSTEGSALMVLAAVERAATWLQSTMGADPDDWRWGRIHTITLRADVFDSAGVDRYNNGPWANDGGWYTVDVASPSGSYGGYFGHGSGPSMRLVCEVDGTTGPQCSMQLPGGQRNRPGEAHYEDLFIEWLQNQSFPLNFSPVAIDAATQEMLTVQAP